VAENDDDDDDYNNNNNNNNNNISDNSRVKLSLRLSIRRKTYGVVQI
jgi:hypothetical protein